ncbi:hypothetical protein ACWEQ4_01090 [Rhodococcus sp. NPDC003994]
MTAPAPDPWEEHGDTWRGPDAEECQSFRHVTAPLIAAPRSPDFGAGHSFSVDCALHRDHNGLHTDTSGRRWP